MLIKTELKNHMVQDMLFCGRSDFRFRKLFIFKADTKTSWTLRCFETRRVERK